MCRVGSNFSFPFIFNSEWVYNLIGEGYFYDFLGDILEAIRKIGQLVFLDVIELDVVRFSPFMPIFHLIPLVLTELQSRDRTLLHVYLLTTDICALDGSSAVLSWLAELEWGKDVIVLTRHDYAIVLLAEGETHACLIDVMCEVDLEIEFGVIGGQFGVDVAEGLHHYIRLLIMEYKADYARVPCFLTEKGT